MAEGEEAGEADGMEWGRSCRLNQSEVWKREMFVTHSFEMPAVWLHSCSATSLETIMFVEKAQRRFFNFLKIGPKPLLVSGSRQGTYDVAAAAGYFAVTLCFQLSSNQL